MERGRAKLTELGRECDVYVQEAARYLAPVWSDIVAVAQLTEGETWDAFAQSLAQRGRARATVNRRVPLDDGRDACTMEARFVAIARL